MLAGFTTFLTMSYIIFVNPQILHVAGLDLGAVFVATCLTATLGCMLMAFLANYPIAVAPGMAVNVYFTYVVVQGLGYSWQSALGAIFITGIIFFLVTATNIRRYIIEAIPKNLAIALAVGIGIFIALLALKSAGIVQATPDKLLSLGHVKSLPTLLFMLGFFIIVILDYHKIFGSIIIGIVLITVAGILLGVSQFYGIFSYPPSIKPTLLALQFKDIFHLQGISVLFALFLVVFFDGTGTLLGFLQQPEFARDGSARMPFFSRALFADCIATIFGSLVGTSSTSPFIESAAGIRVGGRTGLTTLTIAILFLLALFLSPLAKTVPLYAVAPALLYVGVLMIRNIIRLNWNDFSEILPCLITMFMIPFSFSIADGLGCGVISYNAIKLICGKTKDLNWVLFILGLIFIAYFIFRPE